MIRRLLRLAAAAITAAAVLSIWIALFVLGGWRLFLELVFVFYFGLGLVISTGVCIRFAIDLCREARGR